MNSDPNQPQPAGGPTPEPEVPTPADISGDDATASTGSLYNNENNLSSSDQADVSKAIDQLADAAASNTEPAANTESQQPSADSTPTAEPTTPDANIDNDEPVAEVLSADAEEPKEKEEIKPAEPVPGAIGSAFNYSATAPDHSEPTPTKVIPVTEAEPESNPEPSLDSSVEPTTDVQVEQPQTEPPVEPQIKQPQTEQPQVEQPQPEQPGQQTAIIGETPATPTTPTTPGAQAAKPATKKSSLVLALIIIAVVVLIAVIVVFVLFIISGSSNKSTTTVTTNNNYYEQVEESSLICTRISNSADVNNSALASYELKMIANYYGDELSDIATTGTYNYISPESAAEGATQARLAYAEWYRSLGLNTDPFSSSYPVSGSTFTASHFAEAEQVTAASAPLFYLNVENDEAVTDIDSVRAVYVGQGYTCSGSEDAEEEAAEEQTEETFAPEENAVEDEEAVEEGVIEVPEGPDSVEGTTESSELLPE